MSNNTVLENTRPPTKHNRNLRATLTLVVDLETKAILNQIANNEINIDGYRFVSISDIVRVAIKQFLTKQIGEYNERTRNPGDVN